MTNLYVGDIPASELKHYGVKGMKWGVRKKSGSKPTSVEIKTARKRHDQAISDLERLSVRADTASSRAQRGKIVKEIHARAKAAKESGDIELGTKMTGGEKAVHIVLNGPLAPLTIASTKRMLQGMGDYSNAVLDSYGELTVADFDIPKR